MSKCPQDSENNYDHLISSALQKNKLASIATSEKNNEENTRKPGTWNKTYNRREVSRLPSVPSTPSFQGSNDDDNTLVFGLLTFPYMSWVYHNFETFVCRNITGFTRFL